MLTSSILSSHKILEYQGPTIVHNNINHLLAMESQAQLPKEKFAKLTVKLELINAL
jgi:hypothetical protein